MTQQELETWAEEFESFHARFTHLFVRSESREQSKQYLRGLLSRVDRKNTWQMAEAVGDKIPDRMQRLLYRVQWDAEAARDILQQIVIETFGDSEGIGVIDETGFLKKGDRSVGVKRQYSGTAGKVENCQIGTFLTYASRHGHVFLDRRLYLPEDANSASSRCSDPKRRKQAYVPKEVVFQTKPQQAVSMLQHAWEQGVPMRWVTGDEVYGDAPYLRKAISHAGRANSVSSRYVLAVSVSTPVWLQRPEVDDSPSKPGGRPRKKARLAKDAPPPTPVGEVVAAWKASRWKRLTAAEGEKGPRRYDWARQRVVESRGGLPGEEVWLLARRSISNPQEIAYYLSNAPGKVLLKQLARVAVTRYTIEQCFEEGKGETGLDQYEVRSWHSWHRHITLSMMAHTWLAALRLRTNKKGRSTQSLQN